MDVKYTNSLQNSSPDTISVSNRFRYLNIVVCMVSIIMSGLVGYFFGSKTPREGETALVPLESPLTSEKPTTIPSPSPEGTDMFIQIYNELEEKRFAELKVLPESVDTDDWKPYQSQEKRFSVKLPPGWRQIENVEVPGATVFTKFTAAEENRLNELSSKTIQYHTPEHNEKVALEAKSVFSELYIDIGDNMDYEVTKMDKTNCVSHSATPFRFKYYCVSSEGSLPSTRGVASTTYWYYIWNDKSYARIWFATESSVYLQDELNKAKIAVEEREKMAIISTFEFLE